MNYSPEQLKRLQDTETEILKEVIRVCEANNITYMGIYGTALGAVLYHGFVPWDDDIDIAMPRDDYERFLNIAPSQLKEGFSLQHFTTEHDAPAYFAKVRKDGTRFVEGNLRHLAIHHGIFVDIVPLDKVPVDEAERRKFFFKTQFWLQLYLSKSIYSVAKHFAPNFFKRALANIFRSTLHVLLLPVKKSYIFSRLNQIAKKYEHSDSSLVTYIDRPWVVWNAEGFFPLKEVPFGDISLPIPANYDEVLRLRYGDYTIIPPVEKRVSHMPQEVDFGDASDE